MPFLPYQKHCAKVSGTNIFPLLSIIQYHWSHILRQFPQSRETTRRTQSPVTDGVAPKEPTSLNQSGFLQEQASSLIFSSWNSCTVCVSCTSVSLRPSQWRLQGTRGHFIWFLVMQRSVRGLGLLVWLLETIRVSELHLMQENKCCSHIYNLSECLIAQVSSYTLHNLWFYMGDS